MDASDGRRRLIEWRAECYRDPVARLRYLRRAGNTVAPQSATATKRWRISWRWITPVVLAAMFMVPLPTVSDVTALPDVVTLAPETHPADATLANVWLVEEKPEYELYSNGLRIETTHQAAGDKRPYPVYDRDTLELLEWRSGPVGIVYHTTESNLAPFESGQNGRLQRIGKFLLDHVREKRAYHYVIDRFGRVHRVVAETDTANHAGYSVWADGRKAYINLNPSFLSISFESQTTDGSRGPQVSQAQVHAARVLTAMLRDKYGIPAGNCVTHAQVSVAPSIERLGNHIDWGAAFPFGALGLENNYAIANPAVEIFGFRYDPDLLKATGTEFWHGIALGADGFRQRAAAAGRLPDAHRNAMQKRYRQIIKALEDVVDAVEKTT